MQTALVSFPPSRAATTRMAQPVDSFKLSGMVVLDEADDAEQATYDADYVDDCGHGRTGVFSVSGIWI